MATSLESIKHHAVQILTQTSLSAHKLVDPWGGGVAYIYIYIYIYIHMERYIHTYGEIIVLGFTCRVLLGISGV